MKLYAIATGLSLAATALMGQGGDVVVPSFQFQSATTMGGPVIMNPIAGRGGVLVTGSPMSAKEINKTTQTLSDGTEIETSHSTMFYRDSQGRTRTEQENGPILIFDPVAAVRITLNPANKTATRNNAPALAAARAGATITSDEAILKLSQLSAQLADEVKFAAAGGATAPRAAMPAKNKAAVEDLGFLMQNGVLAQGTRSTMTIPQGQIGNNREIHVVNERWYSKDLQMIVKSVNSDPRFGTTTFELSGLSMNAPDPTLFQIPSGYTITEGPAGRGGRGVVVGK